MAYKYYRSSYTDKDGRTRNAMHVLVNYTGSDQRAATEIKLAHPHLKQLRVQLVHDTELARERGERAIESFNMNGEIPPELLSAQPLGPVVAAQDNIPEPTRAPGTLPVLQPSGRMDHLPPLPMPPAAAPEADVPAEGNEQSR